MELIDFSGRKNRNIELGQISGEYKQMLMEFTQKSVYYPKYHLAPPHGLMNDPNGLCQLDGWYHIFYQWFPAGPVHGLKHWYHVKTKDFVNYVDYGAAIRPDTELDKDGCFTGVACKENDTCVLYYTGVSDGIQQVLRVNLVGDNKLGEKELFIPYNDEITSQEFRDPYVYADRFVIVGAQDHDGKGIITVFQKNEHTAEYVSNIGIPDEISGTMIECPNLIDIDEYHDLLIFAPMGLRGEERYNYKNVFSVIYGIGKLDLHNMNYECGEYYELDSGFDFYAPQVFKDEKGRMILLGWLGNSKCIYPSDYEQWAHMMTIPREVGFDGKKLRQLPVRELEKLRGDSMLLNSHMNYPECGFEIDGDAKDDFCISIMNDKGEYISFSGDESEYCLDRTHTTHIYNEMYGTKRYALRDKYRKQRLRIFVDCSSIEIFADDGFTVFTSRFFLDNITEICSDGVEGRLYKMYPIEMTKYDEM